MYNIFRTVINQGNFDLNNIVAKINKYHIEGLITDEQRDELLSDARGNADPTYSFSRWEIEVANLWETVRSLEARVAELEPVVEEPVDPEAPPVNEWPDYVQPTGAHDAYPLGAQITYNGLRYVSLIDNNLWTPVAYPAGWQLQP